MNFKEFLENPIVLLIQNDNIVEMLVVPVQDMPLMEGSSTSRYSVDVNFRTKPKEVMEAFAKISLAYVSAGLKQAGYHVKHVYEEQPLRLLVSSRNWDDGEWVGVVSFNPHQDGGSFYVSKGFFNKDRKTISVQNTYKCPGDSAADITKEVRNLMHSVKSEKDRHLDKLKPIPMKRGPKR